MVCRMKKKFLIKIRKIQHIQFLSDLQYMWEFLTKTLDVCLPMEHSYCSYSVHSYVDLTRFTALDPIALTLCRCYFLCNVLYTPLFGHVLTLWNSLTHNLSFFIERLVFLTAPTWLTFMVSYTLRIKLRCVFVVIKSFCNLALLMSLEDL